MLRSPPAASPSATTMTAVLTRNRSLGRSTSGNVAAALAAAHAAPRASPAPAPPAKAGVAKADHRTTARKSSGKWGREARGKLAVFARRIWSSGLP